MSRKFKVRNQHHPHFVTFTIVNWIDLFTRSIYSEILIKDIKYSIQKKGLLVYSWCIMPSHIHMIIGTNENPIQNIVRDLKSHTSTSIKIEIHNCAKESRKSWLLDAFRRAGYQNGNNKHWQLWQQHYHPIELSSDKKIERCLNYIHFNPVSSGYVLRPEFWKWSSATDYEGKQGLIEIEKPLL